MAPEAVELLRPGLGMRFLDGTVGEGGHARLLLEASRPDGMVLGLDWDGEALERASRYLAAFGGRFVPVRENFVAAPRVLENLGWEKVDGILLDLGLSSLQLERAERGFALRHAGPLDMRMDQRRELRAADLVNHAGEAELGRLLREFGEEERAVRIARALVAARSRTPLETTRYLVRVVEKVRRGEKVRGRVHPATRTFQALRLAVNSELENLRSFLADGYELLNPGGRMVILSYHSLEDRLVKEGFRRWAARCLCPPRLPVCTCGWSARVRVLTPRSLRPRPQEVSTNPRARSAHLRAVERLGEV
jgi:16S rRNA (cytosine1402-N4)-methyltransferase